MSSTTITTAGALSAAFDTLATDAPGAYTIVLGGSIGLTADLDAIVLPTGVSLTLDGGGNSIDGGSLHRGLSVLQGSVTIENVSIENTIANGGPGSFHRDSQPSAPATALVGRRSACDSFSHG